MKKIKAPYLFIFIFTIIVTIVRTSIIEDFPWYFHIISFIAQLGLLILIWNFNLALNKKLAQKFPIDEKPAARIIAQIVISLLVVSPVIVIPLFFFTPYITDYVNDKLITVASMLMFTVILLLVFGFYTYDFYRQLTNTMKERSQLEIQALNMSKEKMQMEFNHLKNQVNPHFLFNTLTSLDGLIQTNPSLASQFLQNLSKVFRYSLEHRDQATVPISEELSMFHTYKSLMEMRYDKALSFQIALDAHLHSKEVPAAVLQNLTDNAVKHNMATNEHPLQIHIYTQDGYLWISNNKQPKKQLEISHQQGLEQLKKLYAFLCDEPLLIVNDSHLFKVGLPLISPS